MRAWVVSPHYAIGPASVAFCALGDHSSSALQGHNGVKAWQMSRRTHSLGLVGLLEASVSSSSAL